MRDLGVGGAVQVYFIANNALYSAEDRLGVNFADHGHTFNDDDWSAMLDFADKHFFGRSVARRFDYIPAMMPVAKQPSDPPSPVTSRGSSG